MDSGQFIEASRRREQERQAALARRALRAREAAERVASRIGTELHARRVVLFGSLVRGRFGERSDVDLAVEGLSIADLDRARALAFEERELDVSITPFERAHDHIRAAIEGDGVVLWTRE